MRYFIVCLLCLSLTSCVVRESAFHDDAPFYRDVRFNTKKSPLKIPSKKTNHKKIRTH
jgi:hypothetical protein